MAEKILRLIHPPLFLNLCRRLGAQVTELELPRRYKGVDSIGNGAAVSAEKFTRAESQIAASIQRRTALLASAGKGERAYQEERIKAAGLDVGKFAPALSALEAAEAKTKTVTHGLNMMGMSAKQFSASMRGVPAQFTDIITSLQGGQQCEQLKRMGIPFYVNACGIPIVPNAVITGGKAQPARKQWSPNLGAKT